MAIVISSDLVLNEQQALEYPLTHARIGYKNIITAASIAGDNTDAGSSVLALTNDFTNERWVMASGATTAFEITGTSGQQANYFAIASHNLGTIGASIAIQRFNGSAYETVSDSNPADNSSLMLLFEATSADSWRVVISGQSAQPEIGIVRLGETLDMQRPIYGGHNPVTLNRSITKREAVTEAGQFVGNVVVRRGFETAYSWNNLSASWYRSQFDPFARHALTKPFFIAWRPMDHPNEVGFGMATDAPRPSNQGVRDLMTVSMNFRGLG